MNKKGFTLIEIIIVIVILGILATLALPRITGQMESAKAAEAMNIFGAVKRAAIDCYDLAGGSTSGTFSNCNTQALLGVTVSSGAKFSYYATTQSGPAVLIIRAASTSTPSQFIIMSVQGNGQTSYASDSATSPFQGIVSRTASSFTSTGLNVSTAF